MNLLALLFSDKKNLATGQNSTQVSSKVDFTALLDRLQHSSSTHSARKTQQPILPQNELMLLDKSLEHSSFMIDDKSFLSTYEHTSLDMKTRSSKAVTASQKRLLVKSFDKNKELQAPLKRKINTNMQNPTPLVQRKFKKDLTRSSWYSDEKISSSYKEPLHQSKSYTSSSLYKQEKSTPHRSSSQSVLTQTPVVLAPLSHQEIRLPAREENQQKVDKKSGRLKDLLSQEYRAMSGTNVRKNEAGQIRKSAIAMRQIFKNRAKLVKKEPVAKASSVSHDFLKKSVQEKGVSQQSPSSILYFGAQRDIKEEQVVSNKEIAKGQEITKSRVERLVSQRDSLQTKSSKGEASLGAYSAYQSKKSPKSQKSGVEARSKGIINEGIAARSIQEDQRPLEGSHGIHKSRVLEAKAPKGRGEASLGAYSAHQSKKSPKSQKSGVEARSKGIINEGMAAQSIQEDQRPLEGSHRVHKSRVLEAKSSKGRGDASLGAYSAYQSKKSPKSQKSGVEARSKGIINEGIAAQSIQEDQRPLEGSHGIHKSRMFEAKGPKGRGEASLGAYSTHQSKKSPKSQKSGVEARSKGIINEGIAARSIQEDQRPLKEVVSPSKEISVHQSGLEDSFKKVVEGSATLQNFQDQNQSSQSFEQYQDQGQTPHTHTPQESEGQLLEFQKRVLTIRLDHTQININFNANQLNLTFFSPAAFHNDGNLGEFIDEVMQQSGFDKYKVTLKDKQKRIEILSREKRRSSHPRSVIDVKV